MTLEILKQIRADVRDLRESVDRRFDALEGRVSVVEYSLRGMATETRAILRILRRVADDRRES